MNMKEDFTNPFDSGMPKSVNPSQKTNKKKTNFVKKDSNSFFNQEKKNIETPKKKMKSPPEQKKNKTSKPLPIPSNPKKIIPKKQTVSTEKKPGFPQKRNDLKKKKPAVRIIPLGGLCEIGKNMTLIEYGNDIIIVDCGMAFPEETMLGIDAVIQDFSYLLNNRNRIRGLFVTHGHEDHIGAIPYLMKEIQCPIYGGRLTNELIRGKLIDKGTGTKGIQLHTVVAGDIVNVGKQLSIEFIRVNHSIADAFALAIRTPAGIVFHTGDFKVDYTPINGSPIDLNRFAQIGEEGVLMLLAESTNVDIPGFSPSESQVGESFQRIFSTTPGRIIIATFSSHVHRMQQIFTAAEKYDRKVALIGRSMLTVFSAANSLGYIKMQSDTLIDINDIHRYPPERLVILTTGSQAEPMSALSRMAFASHRAVEIHDGDTVIISAHPIPGNEKSIYRVINELFHLGAHVIYESLADVHVSGHAYRQELMLVHQLLRPQYFMPVHGEYRMLFHHAQLSENMGMPWDQIFLLNNGDILECSTERAKITGYINANPVLIDGSSSGNLENRVLHDRRLLASDGVVSITFVIETRKNKLLSLPNVQTLGFVFESEAKQIEAECANRLLQLTERCQSQNKKLVEVIRSGQLRDQTRSFLFEKTKRRPVILISVTEL